MQVRHLLTSWLVPLRLVHPLLVLAVVLGTGGAAMAQRARVAPKRATASKVRPKAVKSRPRAPRLRPARAATTRLRATQAQPLRAVVKARPSTATVTPRVVRNSTKQASAKRVARSPRTKAPPVRSARTGATPLLAKAGVAVKQRLDKIKNHPSVKRVTLRVAKISATITRKLDSWQARGPPWLGRAMNAVRTYSLGSIAGYSLKKVKADAKFLGGYMVANQIVSNVLLPGSIAFGMDPVISGVLNLMTTPVTMGVIVLRERYLKKKQGVDMSVADSAKSVLKDYASYAKERRAQSSAKARALATAPGA